MPSTIPYYHSLQVRRSQAPQGTEASIPVLDMRHQGTLPSPTVASVEILRPDFGRTRAKDTAALRALAARVLPVLAQRQAFAPVIPLRPGNDVRFSASPPGDASLVPRAPNPWSRVVARVAGAASDPPPSDPRGCA